MAFAGNSTISARQPRDPFNPGIANPRKIENGTHNTTQLQNNPTHEHVLHRVDSPSSRNTDFMYVPKKRVYDTSAAASL